MSGPPGSEPDDTPACPECGSQNTEEVEIPTRNYDHRCRDCGTEFTGGGRPLRSEDRA